MATVHSKAVVIFVLFLVVWSLFYYAVLSTHSTFAKNLDFEGRACCFTLIVFLLSYDFKCSVALSHGAVGWSAIFDCGIS